MGRNRQFKIRTDDNTYLLKASDVTEARANLERASDTPPEQLRPVARQLLMLVLTFNWAVASC